ncbi:MAG: CHAD domain-containing protein [Verrucomicrobia bacterium]|nr:CHAD domain-containing protein [Verrucomicrobiota bacterium]
MKERTTSGPLLSRRFHLVLLHLAEQARRDLDAMASRPERAIHALRTRMKNLRALLLLVKPRIPKPARKAVAALAGRLKDAFSEQRDAHVIAALRAKFPNLGDSATGQKSAPPENDAAKSAKADASRLIRMASKIELHGLTWADVSDGYLRSYRAGRKAMKTCERGQTAKAFHQWRQPVKEMFYQSQVLQPLDGMKQRRSAAERLSDRLGEMHDLHLLHVTARKSRAKDALKEIAKQQRALRPAIFKAAEKLFAERPRDIGRALDRGVKFHPLLVAQAVRQT